MIQTWVVAYSLILARVGTLVATFPLFGGQYVPKFVKVGLSVALAVLWFTVFGLTPTAELLAASTDLDWLKYGLAIGREILLGVILGYAFNLFLRPSMSPASSSARSLGWRWEDNSIPPISKVRRLSHSFSKCSASCCSWA